MKIIYLSIGYNFLTRSGSKVIHLFITINDSFLIISNSSETKLIISVNVAEIISLVIE